MYITEVEGRGGIYAKVVADSIANNIRLTTLELQYPRFIHSEFMTHRLFSRNASSSRAIPVEKMLEQVRNKPATPIHWGKNQSGMQANEEHNAPSKGISEWHNAASQAIRYANKLRHHGFHKQIVNRVLEPYQFIKVIVTATEWDNFFNLRLHPDAQPEIQELAKVMKDAMNSSEPTQLKKDQWHLPYVNLSKVVEKGYEKNPLEKAIKCSVARCARVSYMNHDNTEPDIEKDIQLHDRLLESGHMSPFEHIATPIVEEDFDDGEIPWYEVDGITHEDRYGDLWSGNFRGWKQYRQLI